jgi:putative hemolysin
VERVPDRDTVQAVLEAIGVTRAGRSEAKARCNGHDEDCEAPDLVVYVIITNCVTINNAACEEWEFCRQHGNC